MSRLDAGRTRRGRARRRESRAPRETGTLQRPTTRTLAALLASVAAGTYLVGATALSTVAGPTLAGDSYPFLLVAALLVVGVPVALWLRYDLRGPPVLLLTIIGFWHVYVPLFGTSGVEIPAFVLALYFAPVYLAAYLLASASERRGAPLVRRG